MNRTEIREKLTDILISADESMREKAASASDGTLLRDELGLSSVAMLYMMLAIEEEFSFRFGDVGVSDFETLGSVVDYIESHIG